MEEKVNPIMYIVMNKGVNMSTGKYIAQGAHAACKAVEISDKEMVKAWNEYGFYTKIVLEARNANHLKNFRSYLAERGINSILIIDEGRTELERHTPTALGVEIVDKNTKGEIFRTLSLFKDRIKVNVEFER